VFFFDEAHLLFNDAPPSLLEKIEQVVRLVRSKGVGVYFVTQNPLDIPDTVLGQLGNRVQHALRAFTPRDQKAVKAAAETMRQNPKFKAEQAITELGVGEALVSFLDPKGRPHEVERAWICPPGSRIGPITDAERRALIAGSVVAGIYDRTEDRESAYERLKAGTAAQPEAEAAGPEQAEGGGIGDMLGGLFGGVLGGGQGGARRTASRRETPLQAATKSAARSIGTTIGRELVRGVLGSLLRRR
jgi:DNA helicase HerA-like ATPase